MHSRPSIMLCRPAFDFKLNVSRCDAEILCLKCNCRFFKYGQKMTGCVGFWSSLLNFQSTCLPIEIPQAARSKDCRLEMLFAATHESVSVKVFGCRPHDDGATHS